MGGHEYLRGWVVGLVEGESAERDDWKGRFYRVG